MAIDTPARIAIVGAGPIGLEAALYARFLGYEVELFERGAVCENLLQRGHIKLFTPFGQIRSTLGLAAITAHLPDWRPPDDAAPVSCRELYERYYQPLSETDLLSDSLRLHTEVLAIGRQDYCKHELPADDTRADSDFRLLVRTGGGKDRVNSSNATVAGEMIATAPQERIVTADAMLDCSGALANHNWLGRGSVPAVGELPVAREIDYRIPDVLGSERDRFAHAHTLVVGAGHSAATVVTALCQLAREAPYTQVTWLTRAADPAREREPVRRIPNDPLPERDRVAEQANRFAQGGAGDRLVHWPGTVVEAIEWQPSNRKFQVRTSGRHAEEREVDRIVACVGHRPATGHRNELQFLECYATQASACMTRSFDIERFRPPGWPQTADELRNPEPDFYVLGAASFGRWPGFEIRIGLEQIRLVFTIIGDRKELNLYESIAKLPA